jgi:Mrp family chromosome partitioning ATPase
MEAYQVLRANLERALRDAGLELPGASVMVTAARRRDGKSTVVANLGVALALAGKRVVLVEADARSSLHRALEQIAVDPGLLAQPGEDRVEPESAPGAGLIDVAGGRAALEDVVQPVRMAEGDLRLLRLGAPASAYSEMLASGRLAAVVARLRSEADIVLLDAPVLTEGRGALQLANHVDALAMVVSLEGVPTRTLHSVRATVPSRRAVDLGFIATGAGTRAALDHPAARLSLVDGARQAGDVLRAHGRVEARAGSPYARP